MRHYCTLFDRNYLARGLALQRSLLRHGGDFLLHVLCLDEATERALSALDLERVKLVPLEVLERWDPQLRAVRPGRRPAEFYFTCKPVLLGYLLERHPEARRITYLDSDLYFFSDAAPAEQEFAGCPVALSPHRFTAQNRDRERYGRFNAGWVSIDASREASRFAGWWRDRCIEWCFLAEEETRFGDQKYLDRVPGLFAGAVVVTHPGINAGPWNLDPVEVGIAAGRATIAGRPLVVFHFHGIQRTLPRVYDCGLFEYRVALDSRIRQGIYRPYVAELAACERLASVLDGRDCASAKADGFMRRLKQTARALARQSAIVALA